MSKLLNNIMEEIQELQNSEILLADLWNALGGHYEIQSILDARNCRENYDQYNKLMTRLDNHFQFDDSE